jgi:hypothetical protein
MPVRLLASLAAFTLIAAGPRHGAAEELAPPSKINEANYSKIRMDMPAADVITILGPAHHVRERAVPGGEALIWEDRNSISVRYEGGKAIRIEGKFNKHINSRAVNEANYQALKLGMSRAEVEKILVGFPASFGHGEGRIDDIEYARFQLIMVQVKNGKVVGMSREAVVEVSPAAAKP